MHYKVIIILSFIVLEFISSSQLSSVAVPIDDWQKLIQEGSSQKFDGQYKTATESFTKALAIAEKEKLPAKCLPISLCRLASIEVVTNQITQADLHFQRIVDLIKTQKEENILDPKVSFWAAVLSDEYMSNILPNTRETCLKRACYLKNCLYGDTHRECLDCLNKLAVCYIDNGKVDKAIRILTLTQAVMNKKHSENKDGLGYILNQLAIKCRTNHQYAQTKQLELEAIKITNESLSSSNLHAGLPSFYSLLGMNAFDQERIPEGKEYFRKAILECSKIKGAEQRQLARQYLDLLENPIWSAKQENKLAFAESKFKELLAIDQAIFKSPYEQNGIMAHLADAQNKLAIKYKTKHKYDQAEQVELRVIKIASTNSGSLGAGLPAFYLFLGMNSAAQGNLAKSKEYYQ